METRTAPYLFPVVEALDVVVPEVHALLEVVLGGQALLKGGPKRVAPPHRALHAKARRLMRGEMGMGVSADFIRPVTRPDVKLVKGHCIICGVGGFWSHTGAIEPNVQSITLALDRTHHG